MRIAFITREFPPETAWGGIGSFYANFAQALVSAGHEVEVFTQAQCVNSESVWHGAVVHRVVPPQRIVGEPVGGDLAGTSDLGEFASSLALALFQSFLRRHQSNPFAIAESHEHLGVGFYINFHRPPGCTTIVRYHSAYHTLVRRRMVDWPESGLITRLEHQSTLLADYRVATSAVIDKAMQEDFALPPADTIIHNLIPARPNEPIDQPVFREDLILFVGRMVKAHKRPDMAVKAFCRISSDFPTWRFEAAGADMISRDGESVWNSCRAELHNVSPQRHFYHGVLSSPDIASLYRRAKIIIVPSAFESFGMIAIEAMREGCVPVVSSDTALADIVADSRCVFQNGNQASLDDALRYWLNNADQLELASGRMRKRAAQYSDTVLLHENLRFYEQAMAERLAPQSRPISAKNDIPPIRQRLTRPLISIVTPSYNQGSYIEETIQSVLNQNYPYIEHIVIDGGSDDNTREIINKYPHLIYVSEKDLGQSHAINKGLLLAKGDVLAYLNSDDLYRSDTFHKIAKAFKDHPEIQILVGNCDVIDAQSKTTAHLRAKAAPFPGLLQYWRWNELHCLPQQSVFFRRSLLAEIGLFDASLHMAMDYEFWLRVSQKYSFHVINETLAAFRIVPTTKTGGRTTEMYLEEYSVAERYSRRLAFFSRLTTLVRARRHVAKKFIDVAEHIHLSTHKGWLPLRHLRTAVSFWPFYIFSPRLLFTFLGAAAKGTTLAQSIVKYHREFLDLKWRLSRS